MNYKLFFRLIIIIIIIGGIIIIIWTPPKPDPICPVCGNINRFIGIAEVILGVAALALSGKISNPGGLRQ